MLLTIITLVEATRDYRAISRRKSAKTLRDVALHGIAIEVLRVMKIMALGTGVYIAVIYPDLPSLINVRNWIMTCVAMVMGLTSLDALIFRHRTMATFRAEYLKAMEEPKAQTEPELKRLAEVTADAAAKAAEAKASIDQAAETAAIAAGKTPPTNP